MKSVKSNVWTKYFFQRTVNEREINKRQQWFTSSKLEKLVATEKQRRSTETSYLYSYWNTIKVEVVRNRRIQEKRTKSIVRRMENNEPKHKKVFSEEVIQIYTEKRSF